MTPLRAVVLAGLLIVARSASAQPLASASTPTWTPPPPDMASVADSLPPVPREFRGVWVATVDNIDWPSKPGLSTWEQQVELLQILNKAVELHLNAVILQVRPAADALFDSRYEPWSEYLNGQMGAPPEPAWDPLAFAVEEAHKRGLELHAWFNPYRAYHPSEPAVFSTNHLSKTHPELVKRYGQYLWLDPGEPRVRQHVIRVITDVVRRYDIDGVHFDDYFYPYKEKDSTGKDIDFPDSASWTRYVKSGGTLSRDDWRRQNVNILIRDLYHAIKQEKPWVKFGISPFGIWRPGNPQQITGFDAYSQLYADSRKWLVNGWVDYFTPQLYWPITQSGQSFPVLLEWWVEQNAHKRNIWPGIFTSRVGATGSSAWPTSEILEQIRLTRKQPGASGVVHFSMKALMQNMGGISDSLRNDLYATQALVPASPWLDSHAPHKPRVTVAVDSITGGTVMRMRPAPNEKAWLWVVRARFDTTWTIAILPGWQRAHVLARDATSPTPDEVALSAVDRVGNEGAAAILRPVWERVSTSRRTPQWQPGPR
ncbi:MAG TPA: family 10 glycosylhydrolase [Gemmatimonadaceae bacterium]|nr:family 10 glycosylhydrolase [Gemmatimonadaceae bacterium]